MASSTDPNHAAASSAGTKGNTEETGKESPTYILHLPGSGEILANADKPVVTTNVLNDVPEPRSERINNNWAILLGLQR